MKTLKPFLVSTVGIVCCFVLFGCNDFSSSQQEVFTNSELEKKVAPLVAFVGDSITARCDLKKFYPSISAVKFGIDGDFLSSFINRMSEVYVAKPSVVVIWGGINDLALSTATPEIIIKDYMLLLEDIQLNLPDAKIVCISVCPVSFALSQRFSGMLNDSAIELNELLRSVCKKEKFTYIDVYSALADRDSLLLINDYSNDGIHPNDAGYEAISKVVYPVIKKLI